ncbi:hypothetical protein IOCL2690_000790000 [Leishmania lindenbergi]|uniref:Uncharacterized protein n=1 Tax=Leishmania lindenbergi TaxID=651832 RepID=A0AAW2ZXN8_9TRYP
MTYETPLALLASSSRSSNRSDGGSKEVRRNGSPRCISSSTTSSRGNGSSAHDSLDTQPPLLSPVAEAPPTHQRSLPPSPAPTPLGSPPTLSAPSSSPSESNPGHRGAPLLLWTSLNSPQRRQQQPAAVDFVHFAPLIQQFDFRRTDIKRIACTGAFPMDDVNTVTVKLRLRRHEVPVRVEPIANIQQAAMRGRTCEGFEAKQVEEAARLTTSSGTTR